MAASGASSKTRQRKLSFGTLPSLLNRTQSMTDQSILGVLNILRMDEGEGQSFFVKAVLPDGRFRLLTAERSMTIKDVVQSIGEEFGLEAMQVRSLPAKTPVNLDSPATSVENGEIAIENAHRKLSNFELDNVHKIPDPRLRCVKELLYCEEVYSESLKCAFDLYAEPLRKWGLNRAEHHTLFASLEPICTLNALFFNKLEKAVTTWDPDTTVVGGLFSELELLWVSYNDYYLTYKYARALLRQKREQDGEFMSFITGQRGSSRPSLEKLLLKPVQQVREYERILSNLLDKTPEDHCDREDLERVVLKFRQIVNEREDEVSSAETEFRIVQVQDKFPHDNLCLTEKNPPQRFKTMAQRRRSAPTTAIKAALGGRGHSVKGVSTDGSNKQKSPNDPTPPASPDPCSSRLFIQEGPVQITAGVSSQDRYLFLFNDLLLIAKPKSATTYKLKFRIRLSEMWTAACIEDVCEATRPAERSFVIGWPTTNYVATFPSAEEKESWYNMLTKYIKEQKDSEEAKSVTLKVYNRDMDSTDYWKSFTVTNEDDAATVVKTSLEYFQIQCEDPLHDYRLWVLSGKEEGAYPLIGHEFPFAIKMNHMREAATQDEDGFANDFNQLPCMDPLSPESQCQFILKKTKKSTNRVTLEVHSSPAKRWKNPIKKSPIINWAMHKKTSSKSQAMISEPSAGGRLFGHSLSSLCTEEEPVPRPVMDLLVHLFRYGPSTTGIFRKSANARIAKEVKSEMDAGKEVTLDEISVLVSASVIKEFLRRLPDCIFESENYEDLVGTNNLEDKEERLRRIREVLERLGRYDGEVLVRFLCVLYHIAEHSDSNNMNSYNLAVCVAPSMLWAPKTSLITTTEQSNAVPPFVQFMIDYFVEIFGEEMVTVLGERSEIVLNHMSDSDSAQDSRAFNRQSSTEDGVESPEPLSPRERNPLHLSDTNLYLDSGLGSQLTAAVSIRNSVSSPSSPCGSGVASPSSSPHLTRHDTDFSAQLRAAFYEPNVRDHDRLARRCSEPLGLAPDSMKLRFKGLRKSPRTRRQLSSTTTSAELIEHKQPKTTASGRKLETAVLRRAHSPQTVHLFPVTTNVTSYQKLVPVATHLASVNRAAELKTAIQSQGASTDSSDSNVTSPLSPPLRQAPPGPERQRSSSPTPDQVFQAVDRRRQPAAPSYHEHMQRMRGGVAKPAFFQGGREMKENKEMREPPRNVKDSREIEPQKHEQKTVLKEEDLLKHVKDNVKELKGPWEQKSVTGPGSTAMSSAVNHYKSSSEPSTPLSPFSPVSLPESWSEKEDSSSSGNSPVPRRLEQSPFGLNLHHRKSPSLESGNKKSPTERKPAAGLSYSYGSSQLRAALNTGPYMYTSAPAAQVNTAPTNFAHSEFFPHEAQTKTHWSSDSTRTSANIGAVSNSNNTNNSNNPNYRLRRGSHTSSSSSVSSLDERSSVGTDSNLSEGKTDVTQIRDLKELAQANGLKISAETAQEIAKVKDIWIPRTAANSSTEYVPSPSQDDFEKMMFTEESYV